MTNGSLEWDIYSIGGVHVPAKVNDDFDGSHKRTSTPMWTVCQRNQQGVEKTEYKIVLASQQ